ncbi:MAG: hypothetical protein WBG90_13265 [Saonia sp.]
MELKRFEAIRDLLCKQYGGVSQGKMMSAPAIHYNKKAFAFFSRKNGMVFRLGKAFPVHTLKIEIHEFNPFKHRGPLSGWYEVGYDVHLQWEGLALKALEQIKLDQEK